MRRSALCFGLALLGCGDNNPGTDIDAPKPPVDMRQCVLDTAAPAVKLGGIFNIQGAAGNAALGWEQAELLQKLINDGCGVMGSEFSGIPIEISYADGEDMSTLAVTRVQEMVAAGVVAIGGAGNSTVTQAAATETIMNHPVGFAAYTSRAMVMNSCTDAQLADGAVTKVGVPTSMPGQCWDNKKRFFRTRPNSEMNMSILAKFLRSQYPTVDTVASIGRANFVGSVEQRQFFRPAFEALGGTVQVDMTFPNGATVAQLKTLIPTLVANNPKSIAIFGLIPEVPPFVEAWVQLSADVTFAKQSNFDTTLFINSTDRAPASAWANVSQAARQYAADHYVNMDLSVDNQSPGFMRWHQVFKDYYPDKDFLIATQASVFDAWFILALAITKAQSTDSLVFGPMIEDITNGTTVYYADQYKEARDAVLRGEAIRYVGGFSSALTPERNMLTGYIVMGQMVDGTSVDVGYVTLENPIPRP